MKRFVFLFCIVCVIVMDSCVILTHENISMYNEKKKDYENRIVIDEILDGTILVSPSTYYFIPLEGCKSFDYNNSDDSLKRAINMAQASGNFEGYRKNFEELSKLNPIKANVKYPSRVLSISVTSNSSNYYVKRDELYIIPVKARMIVKLSPDYAFCKRDSVSTEKFAFSWFENEYTYECIFSDDYYNYEVKSFDIIKVDYERLNIIAEKHIIP